MASPDGQQSPQHQVLWHEQNPCLLTLLKELDGIDVATDQPRWKHYSQSHCLSFTSPTVTVWDREEYHLTAKGGDIHSQVMLLNGEPLRIDSSGNIPELKPATVCYSDRIC